MRCALVLLALVGCLKEDPPAGPLAQKCERETHTWSGYQANDYIDWCKYEGYWWACNKYKECVRKDKLPAEENK